MKRLFRVSMMCLFAAVILGFSGNIAFAVFAGGDPKPGEIYKEFTFNNNNNNWRVTDPNTTLPGAQEFLPNPKLYINLDLQYAVRAEIVIDFWGGHVGTVNKRLRFNNHSWITIPELDNLPSAPPPSSEGEQYMQQLNHIIPIPLSHLSNGSNFYEGTCGTNNWGWGQWGWYGTVVRIYYSPSKSHATGQITSPSAGSFFGENLTINVSTSGDANRVDFLTYYEGADSDGDGVFRDYHRDYHRPSFGTNIGIRNHVGTDTSAPYQATWSTQWVPDQAFGSIKLIARIRHTSGTWFVTNEIQNLTLVRSNSSVKLYKPKNVPMDFWVRDGSVKSSQVNISTLSNAADAAMFVATWNGNDGSENFWAKVNTWTAPKFGKNHFYSLDQVPIPISTLQTGDNTITFKSTTEHHGIEILWPGPHIMVRYDSPGFADVPSAFWAEDYINAIFNAGFTTGCSQVPLMYCPNDTVTRAQMAAFLIRAVEGEPSANYCDTGSPFSDVPTWHWACKYIKRLSELGITTGCGGGNYCPNDVVTRAQMAAFLIRAVEGEPDPDYCDTGSPFPDVPTWHWACKYIKRLSELGITTGCGGSNYCPDDVVTRAQMAAFLARAFLAMP